MVPGFALVTYMFIGWFGDVISENKPASTGSMSTVRSAWE